MAIKTEYLNPARKLVDEVVDHLIVHARQVQGLDVISLAHMMVVVPTAQAGRHVRLALAQRFDGRGVLPPHVVQPMHVIIPSDDTCTVASTTEVQAAFLSFVQGASQTARAWPHLFRPDARTDINGLLGFLDQLNDLWRVLAGGGWLMRDVLEQPRAAELLTCAQGDEEVRWRELADFETTFFAYLNARGFCHQTQAVNRAKTAAKPPMEGIDEIVLPALVDPVGVLYDVLNQWQAREPAITVTVMVHAAANDHAKFDTWGRPVTNAWTGAARPELTRLRGEDIVRAATDRTLGDAVAKMFPSVDTALERPALGLIDGAVYADLNASFLNVGYHVYNPERHPLSVSSLGVLIDLLVTVWESGDAPVPWEAFRALMRSDDVLRALVAETQISRAKLLEALDTYAKTSLATTAPYESDVPSLEQSVPALATAVKCWTAWQRDARAATTNGADFVRAMTMKIYAGRVIEPGDAGKEFAAAAKTVSTILAQFTAEGFNRFALSPEARAVLAHRAIAAAVYQLEPDTSAAVKTEGWLELAWSSAAKIALVGFHEGCVPESLIGHAFLPDALRAALGLTCNEQRLGRDTYLLSELLACRETGAVRAFVSLANNAGELHRPSRLLFLCHDDALPTRVAHLFGDLGAPTLTPARVLTDAWRMCWPDTVTVRSVSPSAIDTYLKCPFTWMLKYGLKMRPVTVPEELGADDFGTLVHRILERYANEDKARGAQALREVGAIRDALFRIFNEEKTVYGAHPTVTVRLQLESVLGRILAFAPIQAAWASEGWRVCETEYKVRTSPFTREAIRDVTFRGVADRIDYHPDFGYRIIDYKTWDKTSQADGHVFAKGVDEMDVCKVHGYGPVKLTKRSGERRMVSVQLPLYARALEVQHEGWHVGDLCYLILGNAPDQVAVEGSAFSPLRSLKQPLIVLRDVAWQTAELAVEQMRQNIFWEPGPSDAWRYDYGNLFMVDPVRDAAHAWVATQEARLNAWTAAHPTPKTVTFESSLNKINKDETNDA